VLVDHRAPLYAVIAALAPPKALSKQSNIPLTEWSSANYATAKAHPRISRDAAAAGHNTHLNYWRWRNEEQFGKFSAS